GSADGGGELDDVCGPAVPWVLRGGGASAETVEAQVEQACRAGASGFIVGRTLFDAALVADRAESEVRLERECRPLLRRLVVVAERLGQPWRRRVGDLPRPRHGWYR